MKILAYILAFNCVLMSLPAWSAPCNDWMIEYNTNPASLDDLIAKIKKQSSQEVPSLKFRKIGKYTYVASYLATENSDQDIERAKVVTILNYIRRSGYSVICDRSTMPY